MDATDVTEVASIPLQPGSDAGTPGSETNEYLKKLFAEALRVPGLSGEQRVHVGFEKEDPTIIWIIRDWSSISAHNAFRATPGFQDFGMKLSSLVDFPSTIFTHMASRPFPLANVADEPVLEITSAFFPANIDDSTRQKVAQRFEAFRDRALSQADGRGAISYGWSVEDDVPMERTSPDAAAAAASSAGNGGGEEVLGQDSTLPSSEGGNGAAEKKTGLMFGAFVGWKSLEARNAFRESQACKEQLPLLEGMPGLIKLKTVHMCCEGFTEMGGDSQ